MSLIQLVVSLLFFLFGNYVTEKLLFTNEFEQHELTTENIDLKKEIYELAKKIYGLEITSKLLNNESELIQFYGNHGSQHNETLEFIYICGKNAVKIHVDPKTIEISPTTKMLDNYIKCHQCLNADFDEAFLYSQCKGHTYTDKSYVMVQILKEIFQKKIG